MESPAGGPQPSLKDYFAGFGPIELQPLSRVQAATARAMSRNWTTIPHVTHHDEADITRLDGWIRTERDAGRPHSLLAHVATAVVATLQAFPRFNASLDSDGRTLILKQFVNLGFAVDTGDGLVVPVVRGCESKAPLEIAAALDDLATQARTKGLPFAAMEGSSFTISSLGGLGGVGFTPIINAPDVAILGVTRARLRPVWEDGQVRPALILPLSLSYDHRVVNGADAARFVTHLGGLLASPIWLDAA